MPQLVRRPLILRKATLISGTQRMNPTGSSPTSAMRVNSGSDELLQLFRHEFEFLLREGDETPVFFPGVVVDFAEAPGLRAEIFQVALTNTGCLTFLERGGDPAQAGRGPGGFSKPPGVEIHYLGKSESFNQRRVVGRVVRGQEGGGKFKAFNEQAADIIGRVIDRAHDLVTSPGPKPVGCGFEERGRHYGVVHTVEKPEAAHVAVMIGVIVWIVASHDPPDDFPIGAGEKKRGRAVFEKGMFLLIEKFLSFEQKRRHPGGIVLVNPPREFDERVLLRFGSDLGDLDQTLNGPSAQRSTRASIVFGVSVFSFVPKTRSQSGEVTP